LAFPVLVVVNQWMDRIGSVRNASWKEPQIESWFALFVTSQFGGILHGVKAVDMVATTNVSANGSRCLQNVQRGVAMFVNLEHFIFFMQQFD